MRAVIGVLALLAAGCRDPCDNESFKEFKSPSAKWKVVVFQRSCGATTDFSTQASLLRADEPTPRKAGNLLAIDSNHGAVAVDSNNLIDVNVAFQGDSSVTLAYPAKSRVFVAADNVDGVAVRQERR